MAALWRAAGALFAHVVVVAQRADRCSPGQIVGARLQAV